MAVVLTDNQHRTRLTQAYMKEALAKLKAEKPDQPHKDRFKEAATSWAKSPR